MSIRVPYETVKSTVTQAFLNLGLSQEKAEKCAEIHTESSLEGIESHGLNRVPRFAEYVQKGWVDINAEPELVGAKGAVENYDGHLGIGTLNATFCMDRAVALAKEHGIGCVALKNTTHWMRGGSYAWQAAQAGLIGLSWTNTESCMPMWGSKVPGVGNNPFCIAIPRKSGPIVLDMAMSQYAYGKLGVYRLAGKQLPFPGGFDKDGNLTAVAESDANSWDIPLVVLADETTGGTAELFVMALQDFGRAKVVGARTAGNGDITEIFKLSGGSAIQVTTAQYAGPKQKSFGDTGVGPDYEVELAASESNRGDILGNAELDAPYKKALEVLAAAIR